VIFPWDDFGEFLDIESHKAKRSSERVFGWQGILYHALNMKSIVQTIAEAVTEIKYHFPLY
jgi:hypothetical protein